MTICILRRSGSDLSVSRSGARTAYYLFSIEAIMTIREKMKAERDERKIFDLAKEYSMKYLDDVDSRGVYPTQQALNNLGKFVEPFPKDSTDGVSILEMLGKFGSPASVNQIGGRYHGFVNGSAIPVSQASRWMTDIWDQNAAMYVTSPISAVLEQVVENWLIEIFDFPKNSGMGFVSGTSIATIVGLITARNTLLLRQGYDVNAKGLFGAPLIRVVISDQAHSSVFKALSLIGLGKDRVELVPSDDQGRINISQFPEIDNSTIVLLQAGNVNTGSFDEFTGICERARVVGAWVHIDGAFGLWAAASEQYHHLTQGMQLADSWSVDGHKTLNTPYDCGIIICRDKNQLAAAMQATGDYLQFSEDRDNMLLVPEMSRRARGIDVWACLKFLGSAGLEELINGLCELAKETGDHLKREGFEVINDIVFNQVLLKGHSDEETAYLVSYLLDSRKVWLGTTSWKSRLAIRISICSWATTSEDMINLVRLFQDARQEYNAK